ncbi:hypothetical protein IJV79_04125 [bacterium]|nr:hypothetical protein [bacterium]
MLNVFWMGLNTFKDFGGIGFSNIKIDTNDWVFEQNPSLPVYLNSINKDNLVMWITHFPDEQKYIFISSDAEIKDKHFYLIFDTRKKPSFERDEVLKLQRLYSDEVFCIEVLQK